MFNFISSISNFLNTKSVARDVIVCGSLVTLLFIAPVLAGILATAFLLPALMGRILTGVVNNAVFQN